VERGNVLGTSVFSYFLRWEGEGGRGEGKLTFRRVGASNRLGGRLLCRLQRSREGRTSLLP